MRRRTHPFTPHPAAFALLALVGLAALLAAPAPALPDRAVPWVEVETDHFHLLSDAGEERTRQVGAELEQLRGVLARLSPGAATVSPVPTTVYVFRDNDSFEPYKYLVDGRPANVGGYFVSHPHGNYVAINGDPELKTSRIVYHEYLHAFLNDNAPGVPLWFNEGLAEYYSSFRVEDGEALIGLPLDSHLDWLGRHEPIPLAELFAVEPGSESYHEEERQGVFYAQSWALVHYLLAEDEERRDKTVAFLDRLVGGEDAEVAFEEVFETGLDELEDALADYLRRRELPYAALPAGGLYDPASARAAPLPRSRVLYHLGDLLAHCVPERRPGAEHHFSEALRADAGLGPAWAGLGFVEDLGGSHDDARGFYQKALELAPDDFLVHYLYGQNLLRPLVGRHLLNVELDEEVGESVRSARAAFERSIRLREGFAEAWAGLGATYTFESKAPEEALAVLEKARRMLPKRTDVAFNLMVVYAREDRGEEARWLLENAIAPRAAQAVVEEAHEALLLAELGAASEMASRGELEAAIARVEAIRAETVDSSFAAQLAGQLEDMRAVVRRNRFARGYNRAVELVNAGRTREAVATLEELIAATQDPELQRSARAMLDRLRPR